MKINIFSSIFVEKNPWKLFMAALKGGVSGEGANPHPFHMLMLMYAMDSSNVPRELEPLDSSFLS